MKPKIPGLGLTLEELQRARQHRAQLPVIPDPNQTSSDCSHEYHTPTQPQPTIVYNITVNNVTNHFHAPGGSVIVEGTSNKQLT